MLHVIKFAFAAAIIACLALGIYVTANAAEDPAPTQPPAGESAAQVAPLPVAWLEIRQSDPSDTAGFYGEVFGWTLTDSAEGGLEFQTPAGLGGRFDLAADSEFPEVVLSIYAPDLEAKLAQIVAAGGKVWREPRAQDGGPGHRAYFEAPSGLIYGLTDVAPAAGYSPDPLTAPAALEPNSLVALELYCPNLPNGGAFFGGVFGWQTTAMGEQYMGFSPGMGVGGVLQNHTAEIPVLAYIWVEDVAATLALIEAHGGTALGEPMEMAGMPVFGYFTDPSGVNLGLMGPAPVEG